MGINLFSFCKSVSWRISNNARGLNIAFGIKFKQGDTKMTNSGKILVTGATGNVGSILIPILTNLGADVRALVRDDPGYQPQRF